MMKENRFYEPEEDSFLLLENALKEIGEREGLEICEVGVGSGFVISEIAREKKGNIFYGTDINPFAIEETKKKFKEAHIKLRKGDLLGPFNKKFDLILFNTPYLPLEEGEYLEKLDIKDRAIYGGEKGYEIIEEFIYEINDKLAEDGVVLLVFSSLSNLAYIEEVLKKNFFLYEILEQKNSFFEKMICMKVRKGKLLKALCAKEVKGIRYLARGKHSIVLEGICKDEEVIIKIGKPQHIEKEVFFLKKLKDESFAPRYLFSEEDFVVREKFSGTLIIEYFEEVKKKRDLIKVLKRLLDICSRLDELGINKTELVNPYKHIFVQRDLSIKMIDYERCIFTPNPKNITQLLEFFRRNQKNFESVGLYLDEKKILELSRLHKKTSKAIVLDDIVRF